MTGIESAGQEWAFCHRIPVLLCTSSISMETASLSERVRFAGETTTALLRSTNVSAAGSPEGKKTAHKKQKPNRMIKSNLAPRRERQKDFRVIREIRGKLCENKLMRGY